MRACSQRVRASARGSPRRKRIIATHGLRNWHRRASGHTQLYIHCVKRILSSGQARSERPERERRKRSSSCRSSTSSLRRLFPLWIALCRCSRCQHVVSLCIISPQPAAVSSRALRGLSDEHRLLLSLGLDAGSCLSSALLVPLGHPDPPLDHGRRPQLYAAPLARADPAHSHISRAPASQAPRVRADGTRRNGSDSQSRLHRARGSLGERRFEGGKMVRSFPPARLVQEQH